MVSPERHAASTHGQWHTALAARNVLVGTVEINNAYGHDHPQCIWA